MKKRLLLIALLLLQYAIADGTVIFSDDVKSEKSFQAEGVTFLPTWFEDDQFMLLKIGDIGVDIEQNDCTKRDIYKVCISNITYLLNGDPIPEYLNSDEIEFQTNITVYADIAELNISRIPQKLVLQSGEKIKVETQIQNIGNARAKDIYYEENPGNSDIEIIKGCKILEEKIVWQGELSRSSSHLCSFYITPRKKGTITLKAKLNYDNGIKTVKEKSDSQKITIKGAATSLQIGTDKKSVTLGDNITLEIFIESTHNESIALDIGIEHPYKVLRKNSTIIDNKWNIEPGQSLVSELVFQATRTGIGNISVKADYLLFDSLSQSVEDMQKIEVESDYQLEIIDKYSQTDYSPGDIPIEFEIMNRGEKIPEKLSTAVTANISGFEEVKNVFEMLGKKTSQNIIKKTVPARPGSYVVNITLRYYTEFDEPIYLTHTKTINVIQTEETIDIVPAVEKQVLDSEDSVSTQSSAEQTETPAQQFEQAIENTAKKYDIDLKVNFGYLLLFIVPLILAGVMVYIKYKSGYGD